MKNILLVDAPFTILFLSDTYGGRVHEKRIAETTPYPLPAGSRLLQDLGFLAFTLPQVEICMPTKKPRGQELSVGAGRPWRTKRCTSVGCGSSMSTAVSSAVAHRERPPPPVEAGYPRSGDGTLLCPAQLPRAPHALATDDLIGINSWILATFLLCLACSSRRIAREVGVHIRTSYRWCWWLRNAALSYEMQRQLEGTVEADDIYHTAGNKGQAPHGGKKALGRRAQGASQEARARSGPL